MLKIKVIKQSKGYCGPASLKMILDFYGLNKSEMDLAKISGSSRDKGVSARNLVNAAKKLGFESYFKDESSLKELEEITKKRPVIVDWCHPIVEGHYSVVCGFEKDRLVIADPYEGKIKKIKKKDFEELWYDFYGDRKGKYIHKRIIVVKEKLEKL